jgi:glycosyltransferase involved in cell wall biosynthesis
MRVLRVITRLNVGGPTRHVRVLSAGLAARGVTGLLAHGPCPEGEGPGVLDVPGAAVLVPTLVRALRPRDDRRAYAALLRVIRDFAPDVVHTHQGKAGFLGRLAASRAKVPAIVHTHHGHTFAHYHGLALGRILLSAERLAAARSHALICQSVSQEADVRRHLGAGAAGKTVLIPPALDPEALRRDRTRAAIRGDLGASEKDRVLLLPARLVPVKRPVLAVELLAALENPTAWLWILGDGPLRTAVLDRARALKVASRVRILPPTIAPGDLYAAADLTVLTSINEGTPLTLIEAIAQGCPVAATAVGGVADLLDGHGTLLVPEASPTDWARRVRPSLDGGRRLDENTVQEFRERHAAERLTSAVFGLYERLLAGR